MLVFRIISGLEAKVAEVRDALNYPYIRVRDVKWLKSTLLLFPHVARIRPFNAPEDEPEIDVFTRTAGGGGEMLLRSIPPQAIPVHLQDQLHHQLEANLARDAEGLRRRFGEVATCTEVGDGGPKDDLWIRRMSGTTQLHHEKIAPQLLAQLREHGLAWEPKRPDHPNYVEMHPVVGNAIMSALAFAIAQAEGMRVVTEFPDIFASTIRRPIGEIFAGVTAEPTRGEPLALERRGERLAEAIVYRHCDLSRLDLETMATLSKEHEALSDFRDSIEDFARAIPEDMTDDKAVARRLEERAQQVIKRWQDTKRQTLPSFRTIFGEEAGRSVQDSLKDAFKDGVKAAGPGMAFGSGTDMLLCAGGGLAIGVVFRLFERTPDKKKDAQSLRYLNILQNHGVSISISPG